MRKELEKLAYNAGKLFLNGYESVEIKGSVSNMVTDSDQAVQDFLVQGLKQIFQDIDFICEEENTETVPMNRKYTAIIDPIDGTSNFVRHMNLSAVSVAVLRHGKPWLGVVYLPFTDELFSAEAGCGATVNGKPIHVSDRSLNQSCLSTAWSLYDKTLAPPCFEICQSIYPDIDDLRRLGSAALELAYLAAGRCELYFEIRLYPWDFAAAFLLIEEAGGYTSQIGTINGDYSCPCSVIAANSFSSFEYLKSQVQRHLPDGIYDQEAFRSLF